MSEASREHTVRNLIEQHGLEKTREFIVALRNQKTLTEAGEILGISKQYASVLSQKLGTAVKAWTPHENVSALMGERCFTFGERRVVSRKIDHVALKVDGSFGIGGYVTVEHKAACGRWVDDATAPPQVDWVGPAPSGVCPDCWAVAVGIQEQNEKTIEDVMGPLGGA